MNGKKRYSLIVVVILIALVSLSSKNTHGTSILDITPTAFRADKFETMLNPITVADVEYWTCPMHPELKKEEPGKCPHCGMDLTPVMTKPSPEPLSPTDSDMNYKDELPDKKSQEES